jgi:mono/diheme cytochrome c family protein
MRKSGTLSAILIAAATIGGTPNLAAAQQSQPSMRPMTGLGMMGPGMMGRGTMGQGMAGAGYGNMLRQHYAMMYRVPAPYTSLTNPLPRAATTIDRGAAVYAQDCAACHGPTGAGNGAAGRNLSPRPTNLASLAQMPMAQSDPYMYWAIAEGGAQFGSAMPAFKGTLSKNDIWAVITFIEAGFPQNTK